MYRTLLVLFTLSLLTADLQAQEVPYHISNKAVYDFVDELANKGIIDINSAIKPYSRMTIAKALQQANGHSSLTKRQQQELAFYLKDFNKELTTGKDFDKRFDVLYHSDSLFKVTVNPIIGGQFFNNGDKTVYHRWGGAEFYGSIGKHLAVYGSLRDNHESQYLGGPRYISQRDGIVYKGKHDARDYSETRGGIVYSWNWGSIGLHKDHIQWGHGYNQHSQLINSALAPSYGYISFSLKPAKWIDFHYYHGWLVSEVLDSTRTYGVYNGERQVFANKFIASNMFTIRPWQKLNISFGNSVIYGDVDFNPTFLVPFLFYKSADHTYNSWDNWVGHNAQMYFDISSRQIKNLHLYTTLFIDEIWLANMFNKDQMTNDFGIKVGFRATDLLPNTSVTAEYTRIRPLVYEHFVPTTTYKSNKYVMGHYLRDNAEEVYFELGYKPIRGLDIRASYTWFRKGKDYQKIFDNGEAEEHPEINTDEREIRLGLPFINEVHYKNQSISFKASYQVINDGFIFVEATKNSFGGPDMELYTNPYYRNGDNILSFGMNFGF